MEELKKNAEEFLEAGEENLSKKRYNVASSDFFKAIVIFADYLLYTEIKILPKSHNQRFSLLKTHYPEVYQNISSLFEIYTKSYNFHINETETTKIKEYAYELKTYITSKK
ncbi:MAG: HEPN domain-containing protein [Nanoarchaeota archaeon]|nr:HEPN domain-containing protein [Nanoarchaeota archaeon]